MIKSIKSKKNLICLLFALVALAFSSAFLVSIPKKASADTASEITITKLSAFNENIAVFEISGDATSARDTSVDVYVNDVKTTLTVYNDADHTNAEKLTFVINTLNLSNYQHIRIPKGTKIGDSTLTEEYTFYNLYNVSDGKWNIMGQESTTPITFTGIKALNLTHGGIRYYIVLNATSTGTVETGLMYNCGIVYATDNDDIKGEYTLYGNTGNTVNVQKESDTVYGLMLKYSLFGETAQNTTSKRLIKVPAGTVWGGYLGKYRITDTFYLLYDGAAGTCTFHTEDPSVTEMGITLENANIKIGGSYTDAYYAFNGSWSDGGWFANSVSTSGDINVRYTIDKETRTADGVYGATRLLTTATASNQWAVTQGLIDFISNGGTDTWKNVANSDEILLKYNATDHRRTLNGTIKWGYPLTEAASGISYTDAGGDAGVTAAYEAADAMGADRFGVAWGGGTYSLRANLQIYDNDNNDLGVLWSTNGTVNSQLSGKIGGTIYFESIYDCASVSVKTASGTEVAVTDAGNGLYSFTMPREAVTISTTENISEYESLVGQDVHSRYVLYFSGTGDGTYNTIGNVNVSIDGESESCEFYNWGNDVALVIPYDICSNDGSLHEVSIKSCVVGNYKIASDVNLWISGYDVCMSKPTSITLKRNGNAYQGNGDTRYVVYFDDGVDGEESELAYKGNMRIKVTGEDGDKLEEFYQWDNSNYALLLPTKSYALTNSYEITTKVGFLVGTNDVMLPVYISNSVTFYICNQEVKDKIPVTVTCNGAETKSQILWNESALTGVFSAETVEVDGLKVIGYRYNDNLYPDLSAVYTAVGTTPPTSLAIEAVTVKLANVYGASIRVASDYQGLRFSVMISEEDERPSEIGEYGVYLTSEAFLKKLSGDFTKITNGTDGYIVSSKNEDFKNTTYNGDEMFSAVVVLSAANYNKNFAACGYIVVNYANKTSETILADYSASANMRSAYEVSSSAIDDSSKYSASQLTYIQKYVDGVLDINSDYEIVGKERSYTIAKTADGVVKITGKEGFDPTEVQAFSINGVRHSATFANGTVTFDSTVFEVGKLEDAIVSAGKSGQELEIMSYYGPSLGIHLENGTLASGTYTCSTAEDVKKYFDAGFNYLVADEADVDGYRAEGINFGTATGTKTDAMRMLDLVALYCDTYGITDKSQAPVVLYDSFIWAIMDKVEYANQLTIRTEEQIKGVLTIHFETYRDYVPSYPDGYTYKTNATPLNCFAGFSLRDEPYGEDLECYNKWYNYLATSDGLNLIGQGYVLVGAVLSPGVQVKFIDENSTDESTATDDYFYNNYLSSVISSINGNSLANSEQYLMTDCYPFITQLNKSGWSSKVTATYTINEHYFSMMSMFANYAKTNNIKSGVCIQSVTHYNSSAYSSVTTGSWLTSASCKVVGRIDANGNLTMNANHIRYQTYMALAYGMERIDYFTYWQHYNQTTEETMRQSAVIWQYDSATGTYKGTYLSMYDFIKTANTEAKKLDEIILAFDWQGTRLVTGTTGSSNAFGDATNYTTDSVANTATAAYDLAVGCFTLGDYKGYMLVNADDPSNERNNDVTINLGNSYNHAIVYINGSPVVKTLTGGSLSLALCPGDGVFVVPVA